MESDGCVCCHFMDAGRQVKQTAWPMPQRKSKRKGEQIMRPDRPA